jgi:TfoX/Sxy family transcriptional regulator of competence genes
MNLVDRVRASLSHLPRVEEKKMFGGTAFMVNGKMCVSARPERILCRIDPALHDKALRRKGCTTMTMKGREYRGYVHVAADRIRTKRDLDSWISLALEFNGKGQ